MFTQNNYPMYQQPYQPVVQTRMIEVVPVESVEQALAWPVAVGATVEFMAKNDTFVAMKSVGMNGQSEFVVFDRRPPEQKPEPFDPSQFVRKDELEKLIEKMKGGTV